MKDRKKMDERRDRIEKGLEAVCNGSKEAGEEYTADYTGHH